MSIKTATITVFCCIVYFTVSPRYSWFLLFQVLPTVFTSNFSGVSNTRFLNLFCSRHPYVVLNIFGGPPGSFRDIKIKKLRLLAAPLAPAYGTLVCRSTPVGNHCSNLLLAVINKNWSHVVLLFTSKYFWNIRNPLK